MSFPSEPHLDRRRSARTPRFAIGNHVNRASDLPRLRADGDERMLHHVEGHAFTRATKRCGAAIVIVAAVIAIAACSSPGNRATAEVDSISSGAICFKPTNGNRSALIGCWAVDAGEVVGLQQGDCISVELPKDPSGPVTSIRRLDGTCDAGVQTQASTSSAFGLAAWFVGTGAVVVVLCWLLPRRHRRRVAERESAVPKPAATPVQVIDEGEPTEVTVVDASEQRRRSD